MKEFLERGNFKSYEQIKSRLDKVLGFEGELVAATKAEDVAPSKVAKASPVVAGGDDLDYFKSLAEQD